MKTALITGAGRGIGAETAQQLAQKGWQVWATGLPNEDMSAVSHPNIRTLALDITQEVSAVLAPVLSQNRLDALVNNAGINLPAPLELLTIDRLKHQFEVNVYGHLRVIQACLPVLKRTQGRIVNVSSLMGKVPMPILGAYSMSKHALEAMSDVLRLELAPFGVTVSVIEMGAIDTPMTANMGQLLEQAQSDYGAGDYVTLYKAMQRALVQQGRGAVRVQKVAQVIVNALIAKTPQPRYVVDLPAWGLLLMKRFAPDSVADRILRVALGLP